MILSFPAQQPVSLPCRNGRVIVLGDPHFDSYHHLGWDPFIEQGLDRIDWSRIDALILAGDLADCPRRNWPQALAYLARLLPVERIAVFPGNHDFYHHELGSEGELDAIVRGRGMTYAQKREIRVGTTRFLCCTLWTDFALSGDPEAAMDTAARWMIDYRVIHRLLPPKGIASAADEKVNPQDILAQHHNHRAWLEAALLEPHFAGPKGKTVVVTHHGPHPATAGITPSRPGMHLDHMSSAFHSDLSDLIARHRPDAWLFGHSHRRLAATIGRTQVRNVSIGYPLEPGFPGEVSLVELCQIDVSG